MTEMDWRDEAEMDWRDEAEMDARWEARQDAIADADYEREREILPEPGERVKYIDDKHDPEHLGTTVSVDRNMYPPTVTVNWECPNCDGGIYTETWDGVELVEAP